MEEEIIDTPEYDDDGLELPKEDSDPFDPAMVSVQMKRLFEYVIAHPKQEQPAHIDDAADVMDYDLTDSDLARICQVPENYSLNGIEGIRNVLFDEIADIDLSLPTSNCGWLEELLGGEVHETTKEAKKA